MPEHELQALLELKLAAGDGNGTVVFWESDMDFGKTDNQET